MKLCISEATTLSSSFAEDVNAYAEGGCPAMEVWLTKLEKHLETHTVAQTRQLLQDRGMTLAAASYQGGLLLSEGEQRRVHYDHFRRRLDLCESFGIPTLLLVPDFTGAVDAATLGRALASLGEAARWAAGAGVRLALEFRGRDRFCSTLPTAVALAASCGEPNVAVNLDVFHYYTGPSKFEDLDLLTPANLGFVQLSDLAGTPRELATDADRVFPGEGDFRLGPLVERLRAIGYDGWVSLELLNPTLWGLKPSSVAELGYGSLQRLIEQETSRGGKP